MRRVLKMSESSTRSRSAGILVGLLCVLTLFLGATAANAATPVPPVVLSQVTWLNPLGGGAISSGDPAGTTFAVNQNGDVILANTSSVLLFNGQTGAITNLGSWGNAQAVTVDSQNNYYVTNLYGNTIVKVPFVNGAYAAFNNNPAAACTGTDTVACWLPNTTVPANGWYFQVTGIAFDAKGDFFWAAKDSNNNTSNSIWECSAACLYGSGSSAQMIYQEPTTTPAPSASSGTGQLIVGSLAIDPWGNIFFTDSSIFIAADYGIISYFSSVKEIPTSAGAGFGGATTGYAAAPITLYSETIGTPGEYDDELDGVAIDSKGTVYVADQYNGIFAIPNTGGTIPLTGGQPTDMYAVSPQGGKTLAIDGKGNLYVGSYQSGDTLGRITVGSLAAPATATGTQFTVSNISAVVNDGAATPALTFTASSGGQVISNGITATPGTGSALGSAMVFPVTLQASPGQVGLQSAVLTATDTATSDTGWATIYVVGQGPMLTLDPGAWNPYTTGFTAPYSVSVDNNGDLAVADEGAGKVFELVNNTSTWVSIGTGFAAPSATAFDANGNLYIADFTNNNVIEIPNVAGVLAPASQSVLVADTVLFGGTALSKPSGLTVGPDGVLYIADLGNKRVVTFNLASGDTAVRVTGLTNPWGLAVDGANSLYVANTGGGNVLVYSGGGVVTTLTPAGVTKPWGVVVDPSGSVIISDRVTGNIVRVPNEAGTLTDADAVIIEKNPSSGYGLAIDGQGDLFTTDSAGKAVYAIWRNQSSLAFGSINDGSTSAAQTLYAVSAGNTSVTLGTPFVTGLTGPFTEAAGATNGCADGALGPVGHYCELSVTFAPTGTMSGMQSGSFTLNSNATKLPTATVSLSGTAVAPVVLTAQTINFTAPATPVTFGAAAVTLAATGGGSGNAVTFTIDATSTPGAGSVSGTNGSTLTFTGVGTIIIDANQAGSATYTAAAQVQRTVVVQAATLPIPPAGDILLSQVNWLSNINGNAFSSSNPAGGSFSVNSNGDAVVANTSILELINGQTGVITNLGALSNGGAVTVDSHNNIYVGNLYGKSSLVELPYTGASTNGGYAAFTIDPASSTPPACGATPTTECSIAAVASFYPGAIAFDKNGNLFWTTSGNGASSGNSIYECTVACLGGTGSPVLIYQEATAASAPSAASGQLLAGGLAIDPWGNLFFTDSSIFVASNYSITSFYSDLNELPVSAGAGYNGVTTGFAASPAVLYTITPPSPGEYDNELDAVAIDPKTGTVYFADQNDGIFAFANSGSALTKASLASKIYTVSTQGAKTLTLDSNANLFFEVYHSGDSLGVATINNVTLPQTAVNASSNVTISAILNDQSCTDPMVTVNSNSAAFTAAVTGTCASTLTGGASVPGTVTFTPTASTPTTQTATLTATDNAGSTGTATATGTLPLLTAQTITFTNPGAQSINSSLTLAATASSKLAVSYTSNSATICTVGATTGVVTFVAPGTCSITAAQAGNTTYAAATSVTDTFAVSLVAQTITFTNPGAQTMTSSLTLAATASSKLAVSYSSNSATICTVGATTGVVTFVAPGTCSITAAQAGNTTYAAATSVTDTFAVSLVAQTIAFTAPTVTTVTFGVAPITLAATGGASTSPVVFTVDGKSTAGAGSITGTALTVTGVGTIIVDANQAATTDYSAAAQQQLTITVNPAAQTIAFTAPTTTTVTYGVAPITLAATGGASTSPVVFTVDGKSTAGAGSITGTALKISGVGTIIVDANQSATANYTAAAQQQLTITVNPIGTVVTPSASVASGGTLYTSGGSPITLSSTTAGAAIYYTLTSGATGTTPTAGSTLYTAAGIAIPAVGTWTLETIALEAGYTPSTVANVTFTVSSIPPNFSLAFSLPAITFTNGGSASETITVTPVGGFNSPITFTCSQNVSISCSFNPVTITPSGGPVSTVLTVSYSSLYSSLHRNSNPLLPTGATLAAALCFFGFRRRRNLKLVLMLAVSLMGLGLCTGCGGSFLGSSSTTPKSSLPVLASVVVTATSGTLVQTAQLQITVNSSNQ